MIDLHCHILPGLDDGPRDFDESLAMARLAAADGVRVIVASPHVYEHHRPDPDDIRVLSAELDRRVAAEGLGLRILPGAEIRATPDLVDDLQAGRVLTVGDRGRVVLVELPAAGYPAFAGELFFRLQLAGYLPLIAHIERYDIYRRQPQLLHDLRERGYGLQINASSLTGREGFRQRRYTQRLLREGLPTVIASDGHNTRSRPPVLSAARRSLGRDTALFDQLTGEAPRHLLALTPTT
jgi:protein-tyrosine phosphatase